MKLFFDETFSLMKVVLMKLYFTGKLHKGLGFQPERGEQRRFGGYCNWCWRIGHKESQCWCKTRVCKEQSRARPNAIVNVRVQQRKRKVTNQSKGRGIGKRKRKEDKSRNRKPESGPGWISIRRNWTAQVDEFGTKRPRVEFVGAVPEHNDNFEAHKVDRAAYVFWFQKCKSDMTD